MPLNFADLCERSNQNLRDFLRTEVDLGITFTRIARYQLKRGNRAHYESSKQKAVIALDAIDRFKDRLPNELRAGIETGRSKLAKLISTL